MLKVRIIPTLLWSGFGLVKGTRFDPWRQVGPVLPAIELYSRREIDELVLCDIDQSRFGVTKPDLSSITDFVRACNVPLTYGGGISCVSDAVDVIQAGADKVLINTHQYLNQALVAELADNLGSQAVVVGIDVRRDQTGKALVFSHCGTVQQSVTPSDAAKIAEQQGCGEIVITSIDRDGTMQGYDLDLIREITNVVEVPVIASGGAKSINCFIQAIVEANASAVAAGALFHFTEFTPDDARASMSANGIPVRHVLRGL